MYFFRAQEEGNEVELSGEKKERATVEHAKKARHSREHVFLDLRLP